MVPGMYKKHFDGISDFYKNIQTVMIIHEIDEYCKVSRTDLEKADVPIHKSLKGDEIDLYDLASYDVNAIIIMDKPSKNISKKLLKQNGLKANKKKVTVLTYSDDEMPNYLELGNEIEEVLKKLSE
jgi:hypothetical protein